MPCMPAGRPAGRQAPLIWGCGHPGPQSWLFVTVLLPCPGWCLLPVQSAWTTGGTTLLTWQRSCNRMTAWHGTLERRQPSLWRAA